MKIHDLRPLKDVRAKVVVNLHLIQAKAALRGSSRYEVAKKVPDWLPQHYRQASKYLRSTNHQLSFNY